MSVKGARALASGMLVLAAICAAPAVSAAQDADTTTSVTATTATTTTTPEPVVQPADPVTTTTATTTTTTPAPPAPTVSSPTRKAHASASASVTMGDFFFSPASVTVSVGDTVTWRNTGQAPHNATGNGGSFSTTTIDNGESASHTFNSAGTFSYICTIHPQMKGTVRVLSAGSGGGGGSGGSAGSSGSGTSESSAVASPSAAGDSNTLPMTGMAVGALALVGLALLASGLMVRRAGNPKRSWLSIF
jgi:plastocyanin